MSEQAIVVVEAGAIGDIQVIDVIELGPDTVGPPGPAGPAGPAGPPGPPGTGADMSITSGPNPPDASTPGRFYLQTGS